MRSRGTATIPVRVKRGIRLASALVVRLFHTPMRPVPSTKSETHPGAVPRTADSSPGDEEPAPSSGGGEDGATSSGWDRAVTQRLSRVWWMALAFAAGSACFLVGPFPGYLALVGPVADAVTFFAGSLLFTTGGALQVWVAAPARGDPAAGRAAWRTATVQFAGT